MSAVASPEEPRAEWVRKVPVPVAVVASLTLVGFVLRLVGIDEGLFGDEISTYWIAHDHSLGEVIEAVDSNYEITPPLSFALSWLSLKVGSGPEWIRIPALIGGTAAIPLVYVIGVRTVGRVAGVVAAGVMALSPFMIYYSTEARAYSVAIAFVAGSTTALLAAIRTGRARWWVVYGVCSCLAMYSHYTSAFPLGAQAAWALWTQRQTIKPLILANLGALLVFAPWLPSFFADSDSPNVGINDKLQRFTGESLREALEQWSLGFPLRQLDEVPGTAACILIGAGLVLAVGAVVVRRARRRRGSDPERTTASLASGRLASGGLLIALLALATPVGQVVYSALGPDQIGARNFNPSTPGLVVGIGAIVSAAGPPLVFACAGLILAGFGVGASKTLDSQFARPAYPVVTEAIQERWQEGDVVLDAVHALTGLPPTPFTGLDVYLPASYPQYRLGQPVRIEGGDPLRLKPPIPPLKEHVQQAFAQARGHKAFLVAIRPRAVSPSRIGRGELGGGGRDVLSRFVLDRLPPGYRATRVRSLPGAVPLELFVIEKQD